MILPGGTEIPTSDELLKITPLGETITIQPPVTIILQSAGGGLWIHHVDADGKPAGGIHNGRPYKTIDELFTKGTNQ